MSTVTLKTASETDFFRRGRELAELADKGSTLPEDTVISFEDPADLLRLLTAGRLTLFREIKKQPGSITALSERLHRDRSAVKRDVEALAKFGLLRVEAKALPGHGRMKEVRAASGHFRLEAQLS